MKFDRTEWNLELTEVPNQKNGFDCGVFTCSYIESIQKNIDYQVKQEMMNG